MLTKHEELKKKLRRLLPDYAEIPYRTSKNFKDVFEHLDEEFMTPSVLLGLLKTDEGMIEEIPLCLWDKKMAKYVLEHYGENQSNHPRMWIIAYIIYRETKDERVFKPLVDRDTEVRVSDSLWGFFSYKELDSFRGEGCAFFDDFSDRDEVIEENFFEEKEIWEYIIPLSTSYTIKEVRETYYKSFYPTDSEE